MKICYSARPKAAVGSCADRGSCSSVANPQVRATGSEPHHRYCCHSEVQGLQSILPPYPVQNFLRYTQEGVNSRSRFLLEYRCWPRTCIRGWQAGRAITAGVHSIQSLSQDRRCTAIGAQPASQVLSTFRGTFILLKGCNTDFMRTKSLYIQYTAILMRSNLSAAQAAAVAAPPLQRGQIEEGVGLTDAPLRSLYPEVPVLPKVMLRLLLCTVLSPLCACSPYTMDRFA